MSTKYKKLSADALMRNAQQELKHALPARFREKRVTGQQRIEIERLARVKRYAKATQQTTSKVFDMLIDEKLPKEKVEKITKK